MKVKGLLPAKAAEIEKRRRTAMTLITACDGESPSNFAFKGSAAVEFPRKWPNTAHDAVNRLQYPIR